MGHGGTLDPLAEGLMILGIGREGTKKLAFVLNKEKKEYEAVFRLGAISGTYDSEGPIIENLEFRSKNFELAELIEILRKFTGEIEQVPPIYSAIKIGGKRAYKLARQGKDFVLKPRKVFIEKIEILNYSPPDLSLRINCGAGTYIRSLAHDFGQALGIGAYLKELKRTKIGEFSLADVIYLEDLEKNPGLLSDSSEFNKNIS